MARASSSAAPTSSRAACCSSSTQGGPSIRRVAIDPATAGSTSAMMNWFKNLSIGTRLAYAFSVVIGLGVILGGFTLTRLGAISDRADVLSRDVLVGITASSQLQSDAAEVRRQLLLQLAA